MRNILVTDTGEEGESIMVFADLEASILAAALRSRRFPFSECYEVPDSEVQFYLFEPLWLSAAEAENCRILAGA